ncbi:MAG: carboxypeptidase regulatory-like domain-containing protein, partial [Bryobacteraceae bacterium]
MRRILILLSFGWVSLCASLCAQNSVTSSGTVKFGNQPLPGATVTATEGNHRAVTTTDESGAYQFTDLAPGTYTVEVQMFGFQTARKQIQAGAAAQPTAWSLELQPLRQREPREVAQRPQQQAGGFRAAAGSTEAELDQIAAVAPQDNAPPAATASSNANEAFLVNGSLSNGLQTGQDDFGLRGPVFGIQAPGGLPGAGIEGQPGGIPGAPGGPGGAGGPGGGGFGGGRGGGFG